MKPYKYRGQVTTASSKVEAIKEIVVKNKDGDQESLYSFVERFSKDN